MNRSVLMHDFDDDDAIRCRGIDDDVFIIEVHTRLSAEPVRATAFPMGLRTLSNRVSVTVEWSGVETITSIAKAEVDSTPWGRRLQVVYCAVYPGSGAVDNEFDAEHWLKVQLSMPDADGIRGNRALVVLDRETWSATLQRTAIADQVRQVEIPIDWRNLDVGTLLVEMSFHLLGCQPA